MTSSELAALYRTEMWDTVEPYFLGDSALYAYINDAQLQFCRQTEGIEDSRTAGVTQLAVTPGTEWYALSPLVLKVRGAHRGDDGRMVRMAEAEKTSAYDIKFDGRAGPLRYLVSGLDKGHLRAWPIPTETLTINLRVFRLPLTSITGPNQALEIDPQHHMHLLLWVKHLAYGTHNAEVFDPRKSEEFAAKFAAYCRTARVEQGRARHSAGAVLYGGI